MRKEGKRKALAALVCGSMLTVALVGGTLAYLSDTDSDVNVMTLGNVEIEQVELERVEQTNLSTAALQDFNQNKPLYPAVGEIKWVETEDGERVYQEWKTGGSSALFDAGLKNVQDKFVFVENTGKSDAYVRTWFAFEAGDLTVEEINNGLVHWNRNADHWAWTDFSEDMTATIDGQKYYLRVATYVGNAGADNTVHANGVLPKGETTRPSLLQVFLDGKATNEDIAAFGDSYEILAFSQAVQVEGFDSADAALSEAFGVKAAANHPWGNVALVDSAEELTAALAAGGDVALASDLELKDEPIIIADGTEVTLDLNGFELEGIATNASASNLIKVNNGATLTIKDGTVSFGATTPDTNWGGEGQPSYPGYANNTISNLGTLIIDGATIENVTAPGGASYAIDCYQGSELIVNSGKIDGQGKCAIRMFCNSNTLSTDVTINGGVITGKRAIWVQLPGNNIANVRPVNLTINGGELICTNTEADLCIYSYSYGDSFENTNIIITGGTFTGDVAFGGGNAKSTQENVTITGGTFNGELGRYLANDGWEDIAKP